MNRRAALLLLCPLLLLPVSPVCANAHTNIIFILTDDQRFDTLGCMGNEIIQTPAIDQMAREGVVFDNMFCTTSICAVSRASFMTGQYARRHGINDFRTSYTPEQLEASFPMRLRAAGYRTGLIGKWGIGGELPADRYDYWRGFPGQGNYFPNGPKGESQHLEEILRNQALEFLEGCSTKQPFLLQLYHKAAHCQDNDPWPFQPDPKFNALYADLAIPLPPTSTEAYFERLPEFLKTSEARKRWHIRFENPELHQKSLRDYYRLIASLDETLGALRDKVKQMGMAENTVFIYTSDNGFYLGDRGLAGKWYIHEESIRLPLVIHHPQLTAQHGTRRDQVVLNIDIAPTIFEVAGQPIPEQVQGKSLLPLLRGETPEWRTEFLYEHLVPIKTIPQSEGLRTPDWKYVRYLNTTPPTEELFHLRQDPLEARNLAGVDEYQDELQQMRANLEEKIEQAK